MTLGELNDALTELKECEQSILDAVKAIEHGGNATTMTLKMENKLHFLQLLKDLRDRTL